MSHTQAIEKKMKHLERTPGSLRPPDPATILHNLPCFSGLDTEVVDTILTYAEFVQLEQTESLLEEGAESKGIYVIVSGLVKVCVCTQRVHYTVPFVFNSFLTGYVLYADNYKYGPKGICSFQLQRSCPP